MPPVDDQHVLAALRALLERVHLATPGQIPDVVAAAAGELGWTTAMYLVDYEQRHLVPFSATGAAVHDRVAIEGTLKIGKSTRLNSSHANISYAVFCLKKKKKYTTIHQHL